MSVGIFDYIPCWRQAAKLVERSYNKVKITVRFDELFIPMTPGDHRVPKYAVPEELRGHSVRLSQNDIASLALYDFPVLILCKAPNQPWVVLTIEENTPDPTVVHS